MTGRNLKTYYKTLVDLSFYHKYSIETLENMPVYEFEGWRDMIITAISEEVDRGKGFI